MLKNKKALIIVIQLICIIINICSWAMHDSLDPKPTWMNTFLTFQYSKASPFNKSYAIYTYISDAGATTDVGVVYYLVHTPTGKSAKVTFDYHTSMSSNITWKQNNVVEIGGELFNLGQSKSMMLISLSLSIITSVVFVVLFILWIKLSRGTRTENDALKPIYKKTVFGQSLLPYANLAVVFMIGIFFDFTFALNFLMVSLFICPLYSVVSLIWSLVYIKSRKTKKQIKASDYIPLIISSIPFFLIWKAILSSMYHTFTG